MALIWRTPLTPPAIYFCLLSSLSKPSILLPKNISNLEIMVGSVGSPWELCRRVCYSQRLFECDDLRLVDLLCDKAHSIGVKITPFDANCLVDEGHGLWIRLCRDERGSLRGILCYEIAGDGTAFEEDESVVLVITSVMVQPSRGCRQGH